MPEPPASVENPKPRLNRFFFASAVKVLHKNYLMNRIYIYVYQLYIYVYVYIYIYICM